MPPTEFDQIENFLGDVTKKPDAWAHYVRSAYDFIEAAAQEFAELSTLRVEVGHLQSQLAEQKGVISYQKTQIEEWQEKWMNSSRELERARVLAIPTVNTPLTSEPSTALAKEAQAPTLGTPTPPAAASTTSAHLSERLPDPDRFTGQRDDLRRFVSQIHQKMLVNRDRFPTANSRMAYVTSRLNGTPYNQILPHIRDGVCQLEDYTKVLEILERAFGDPNRVNNARAELFRLRQTNKEFSAFFAEFQRLALEGNMYEDGLPTLLEQAINRELREMLMHSEPPSREYHQFADHLQNLENRRRHYAHATLPTTTRTVTSGIPAKPVPRTLPNPIPPKPASNSTLANPAGPVPIPGSQASTPAGEPMDLSAARRLNRRENGLCYRCGAIDHHVRSCPLPDRRLGVHAMHAAHAAAPAPHTAPASEASYQSFQAPSIASGTPHLSSPESENGASLA
jgi:hypothetical protein